MNRDIPFGSSKVDDRIDERCDAFEAAWRTGVRPNIGEFIWPENGVDRNKLVRELLLVDIEWRRSLGDPATPEYYLRLFPEFASQIDAINLLHGATIFSVKPAKCGDSPRTESRLPGARIAHFELVDRLGAGAMGEAWKAWDTRIKRNVTLKFPHCTSFPENALHRFLREVEVAGQLKHPQLAAVHSIEKDEDSLFIVAAFVDGDNLRDYALKRQLQYHEIVDICAGIGEALQHAHDAGVVHRDLKPANIIVDPNGLPHIIDFGLAKILDAEHDLTMNGELLGTPAYMSPELASGGGAQADARTDIYSLGIILYELLSGRCPFVGDRASVIGRILACQAPRPRLFRATIPRDLETICLKAIEKTPADTGTRQSLIWPRTCDDLRAVCRFMRAAPASRKKVGVGFAGTQRWHSRRC
jgi:eukaryotic-like serine/threonine-protein kinase